jgi:hypothetical protein
MTGRKVFLILVALAASGAIASAQETGAPGAGKLEIGGFPGGGLFLVGGDDNTEVNFNNYNFGGGATWYLTPMAAIEGEAAFGLGISQNVNYKNRVEHRIQMPHTLSTSGNVVIFPAGSERQLAGYLTGGVGTLRLVSRTAAAMVFGLTNAETFFTTNVGGGMKIFRRGDHRNWGLRIDYRILMVNSNSDAVELFAHSKRRIGHRFYVGLLHTLRR